LVADKVISLGANATEIAVHLYDGLRTFKEGDVDLILCQAFSETGIGQAIMNRLKKAASSYIRIGSCIFEQPLINPFGHAYHVLVLFEGDENDRISYRCNCFISLYGCRTWNGRILGRSWYRNATTALETDSIERSYDWIISYSNAIYWYCAGKSHFCPNRPLYDTCRWSVNGRHRRTNVFLGI